MGIKPKSSTSFNLPSNAILECVHQVFVNNLQTFYLQNLYLRPEDPFEEFITASAYAICSTFDTTLGATPAELFFGRDMFLTVLFEIDWNEIQECKQNYINHSNRRDDDERKKKKIKTCLS